VRDLLKENEFFVNRKADLGIIFEGVIKIIKCNGMIIYLFIYLFYFLRTMYLPLEFVN
jgi:hypothetical protein